MSLNAVTVLKIKEKINETNYRRRCKALTMQDDDAIQDMLDRGELITGKCADCGCVYIYPQKHICLNNKKEHMKLTDEYIAAQVVKDEVFKVGAKTTIVVLTLRNGFEVVGTASCVDANDYNQEKGAALARARALSKVWELEGYTLQNCCEKEKTGECTGICAEMSDPSAA